MLAAVAVIYWLLFRSKLGFAFRISGENPGAARYAGIRAGLTIVLAMAIAGALVNTDGDDPEEGVDPDAYGISEERPFAHVLGQPRSY